MSLLFGLLSAFRRWCYRNGLRESVPSPVPLIIVGNISVGGTGKTPLTQALVKIATQKGLRAGIVSRGHGGEPHQTPIVVDGNTNATFVGDEPLLHFLKTGVPVVVSRDRSAAVATLAAKGINIAFSDDGMQHYRMQRNAEIAVVDGETGFANAWLMPAGPLREPIRRLATVDVVAVQVSAVTGHLDTPALVQAVPGLRAAVDAGVPVGSFYLSTGDLRQIHTGETKSLSALAGVSVTAMAGIGSPERFFQSLERTGLTIIRVPLADHHHYSEQDFAAIAAGPVIVTGKDAVKLKGLQFENHDIYELDVDVQLSETLEHCVTALIGHEQLARTAS